MNRTETNPDHSAFYVSALDAGRYFLIAGPYATHDEAKARVDAVCARATERVTSEPVTHADGCEIMRRFTVYPWRRLMLVAA